MTPFRTQFIPRAASMALLLIPGLALAHTGSMGHGSAMSSGLLHPLLGADHLLAMVAVGLWAAQQSARSPWLLPGGFLAGMVLGALLGAQGFALSLVEPGIAGSVVVLGLAILGGRQVPAAIAVAATGLFGMFHGYAHGAEMPAAVAPMLYGAGFVLSTALLHGVGVLGGRALLLSAVPVMLRVVGGALAVTGSGLLLAA